MSLIPGPEQHWNDTEEQQQQWWDEAQPGSAKTPFQATHWIVVGRIHQDLGYGPKPKELQPTEHCRVGVSPGGGIWSGPGVCDAAG